MARGTEAVLLLVIFVATVAFFNATLGPVIGITPSTGAAEDVEQVDENVSEDVESGVTQGGELSPLSGFGLVTDALGLLTQGGAVLVNFGVPPEIAEWIVSAVPYIIVFTVIIIVVRVRL